METPQRFWQGMTKTAAIEQLDKIMIGNNADGSTKYADVIQLIRLLSALGGSAFKGVVKPTDSPIVTNDQIFYVASPGVYPNFGNVTVTGAAAIIGQSGTNFTVSNINIDLAEYGRIKNTYTMGAINGTITVEIDVNGTVRTASGGAAWVQYGSEFLPIANPTVEVISGTNAAGLNWIYYFRSTQKIRVFNYTSGELPLSQNDAVLLGYMFDTDVSRLTTLSDKNIKVGGYFKNRVCGSLTFKSTCVIDKVNHKIILADAYYQSTYGVYDDVKAGDYFNAETAPHPFTFDYDPGLLLQSLVFDPDRLRQGVNPFYLAGVGYAVANSRQILIATIVSNNITTDFNFDEVSNVTTASIKNFYGQRAQSILGAGTLDIKTNGSIESNGQLFMVNADGNYLALATGTNPLKAGVNTAGLNWIVYNQTNAKVYMVNYTGGGIDREIEHVIGYMYNVDPNNLDAPAKFTVNGVAHGGTVIQNPTGELLLPKKIFLENGRGLPVYKRSIMRNRVENQNELVVIKNGASEEDFTLSREYVYGSYLVSPYAIAASGNFLGFGSVNNFNGEFDFINDVQILKKAATAQTIKGQQIGDSLTNRGISKYISNYLGAWGITYNTFGTLDNSGKQGEGREGWTFSNFIGRSNMHFTGTVIPRGNANMNQNPFLKLADANDKANHPTWCFRNTGSASELSYASDPVKTGDFYIFDYAYYMGVNNIPADLQVVTIALSTNDFSFDPDPLNRCVFGLTVMLTQIKAALPNVKIGVIPTPVYGSDENGINRFAGAADWINGSQTIVNGFNNVDVIGVWAHMSSVFDFPYQDLGYLSDGNRTKKLKKTDIIHFDSQGYLQYAPAVGNWIINVV